MKLFRAEQILDNICTLGLVKVLLIQDILDSQTSMINMKNKLQKKVLAMKTTTLFCWFLTKSKKKT